MQVQVERARLQLRVECQEGLPDVQVDSQRLEQVLVNLIHNAVKFTRAGGEVVLFANSVPGEVRFGVRDTGDGIPADEVSRIFERFYRVDKARSREKGGTGLGLAIVRHILALHGGRASVTSVVGQGSIFRIELPQGAPTSAP